MPQANPPFERDAPEALSFCATVILARPSILRYSVAARPNNVVRGVDFGERRAAPYNSSVERTRLRRYALLGITALRAVQPREGVAHLAPRWAS